jgi:hypothetical protein
LPESAGDRGSAGSGVCKQAPGTGANHEALAYSVKEKTDMKPARLAGVALIAILAMSLVSAAAASAALPEFKPASGTFKTSTLGNTTVTGGGNTVTCTHITGSGEITGAMSVGKVLVKFTGCTGENVSKTTCVVKSKAGGTGEIDTNTLSGLLGLILATIGDYTSDVGLYLFPAPGSEFTNLIGSCIVTSKVTGSIAGEVTPIGTLTLIGKLSLGATGGKQNITKIDLLGGVMEPELEDFSAVATVSLENDTTFNVKTEVT